MLPTDAARAAWLRTACVVAVPVVLAPLVIHQTLIELASPLFRDATQNQYTGWCVAHGVKLYAGIGAPDGPFIHFVHALIQLFVGIKDSACRRADLVLHVAGSGLMGALLAPRVGGQPASAPRCALWALVGVSLWLSWYMSGGWWHTVHTDPYYALCGYVGLVLVYASGEMPKHKARLAAMLGGAFVTLVIFSRHSGIAFPGAAAVAILFVDDPEREMRGLRAKWALLGALIGAAVMVSAVVMLGSIPGFWFWYFRYPFGFYRWVGKQNGLGLIFGPFLEATILAVVLTAGLVAGIRAKMLPRRSIAFAVASVLFLIAACIVGKGWSNHVQQTTAATIPAALLLLGKLSTLDGPVREARYKVALGLAVVFVGYRIASMLVAGPSWAHQAEEQADIAPAIAVGEFVKAHTRPDDTMFFYGHELHAALYAERRPAVPYVANMMINTEGWYRSLPAAPGVGPNPEQRTVMKAIQAEIAADTCERLMTKPPAAMVFLDESLGQFHHGVAEVTELCPTLPGLLSDRYTEVPVPGADGYHVYLKTGVAP